MKLLLVYPQQANKPKQRVSRAGAQLHGIAHTARVFLDNCISSDVQIQEFAYDSDVNDKAVSAEANRERLAPELDDIDLIVEVSPANCSIIEAADFAGPVLHLSPTFGGSFVCNDINALGRGRLSQSDVVTCVDKATEKHQYLLPSTHELDANMHYASFSPLPTRVGDAFYRNEKDHALVFLSYPEHVRNEETINSDLITLSEILYNIESLRSITFVCETLSDVPMIQQVADGIREALGLKANIWGLRRGEYHDMYSIMSKSNVVLCGGSSLYADAIIRGMPVFPWRSEQSGTTSMAETYEDYKTDREETITKQREQLDQLIDAQYLDGALPNFRPCFEMMLSEVINMAVNKDIANVETSSESAPQWVIAPARLSDQRDVPDKMSRSLWNDRQRLLQFKQGDNKEVERRNDGDRQTFTRL